MEYRRMGASGLVVSAIGLGTNNFGGRLGLDGAREVVHAALDAGITFIDTADVYSAGVSEEYLGEALAGVRDDVIIGTKFGGDLRSADGNNGEDWGARGSRRYIRRAVESSLRRLRTDWIDLYQLHLPDPGTPILETLEALNDLVREGKVRYVGHTNFSGFQIAHAEWTARLAGLTRFVSSQNRYSLLVRDAERDVVPAVTEYRIGLIPHTPLAAGMLTGKYRRGEPAPAESRIGRGYQYARLTDEIFDTLDRVAGFADLHGLSMLEVAIGALAAKPTVASVIAGAMTAEQVKANVRAAEWHPTAEQLTELDAALAGSA